METHRVWEGYSHIVCIVLALFLITGLFSSDVFATRHDSLLNQPSTSIAAPPVLLQAGTAGASTIYANNTSANVNVAAPEYQYVTQQSNIDGVADVGTHSNFAAQQYGPDLINDTLTEGNTGAPTKYEYYNTSDDDGGGGAWVTNSTFGINSIGSTSYPTTNVGNTVTGTLLNSAAYLEVDKCNTTVPLTALTIETYGTANGNVKVAIYGDSSGSPGTLLFTEVASAVTASTWSTITISNIYLAAGTYWTAFNINTQNAVTHISGSTGAIRLFKSWTYATAFPTSGGSGWTTAAAGTQDCIYFVGVQIEGYAKATKAMLPVTANVQSISFYSHATGNFRLAIYTDSGGAPSSPSSLQWESSSTAATTTTWNNVSINLGSPSSLTLNAGTYWLVWQWDSANSGPSYTVGNSGDGNYIAQAYGSFPTSWSGGTSSSEKWSIYVNYTATYKLCQTFNSSTSVSITSVKLLLYRTGNPRTVTVGIYATTGNPAYPTGSVLTSGTTNGTTLPTASPYEWREITLTTYTLQANTTYAIVVECQGVDGNNAVYWRDDSTSPTYANGMYGRSDGSGGWGTTCMDNTRDNMFEEWGASYNYQLAIEEQWTNANSTATNEELDIYMRAFSTPASILSVQWYNTTSSSWLTIISSLNASAWNNVTVVNYLTSSTFTIQFVNTTSGTTQSWWQIDCALLHLWTASTYDYVLNVVNQVTNAWNASLQVYGNSNIARLSNATISFHDGTSSNQIVVNGGSIVQSQGALYNLLGGSGTTIHVSISNLLANATGASYLYVYLKILTPNTSTFLLYTITFAIT